MKWKLVPEEPTIGMIGAAGIARSQPWRNGEGAIVRPIWGAMLAASPQPDMTSTEKIDAALDSVLKASGSALKYYTLSNNIKEMRCLMQKIMSDEYIAGSNAAHDAMKGE